MVYQFWLFIFQFFVIDVWISPYNSHIGQLFPILLCVSTIGVLVFKSRLTVINVNINFMIFIVLRVEEPLKSSFSNKCRLSGDSRHVGAGKPIALFHHDNWKKSFQSVEN